MLFDSLSFKAMESSLNALDTKQQVISQNLSNIDTPGYKCKEVSFKDLLDNEINSDDKGSKDYAFETKVTQSKNTYFTTEKK